MRELLPRVANDDSQLLALRLHHITKAGARRHLRDVNWSERLCLLGKDLARLSYQKYAALHAINLLLLTRAKAGALSLMLYDYCRSNRNHVRVPS